ncbi:hypothetical protein LMANV2_70067 [Leptospira interrogans serovar Manilae]|uniref:Uncharacterized protein n=1 Tax=Leptospira interrogans serovar Manilae TaxID=214675 RepID=A0AAQ1P4B4_LEPIR|nr:hypothetical protein LMANV2_70067 [Leptospira interrogans serovar Manilae]
MRVTASHLSYEIRELNYYDLKCLFAKIFLHRSRVQFLQ